MRVRTQCSWNLLGAYCGTVLAYYTAMHIVRIAHVVQTEHSAQTGSTAHAVYSPQCCTDNTTCNILGGPGVVKFECVLGVRAQLRMRAGLWVPAWGASIGKALPHAQVIYNELGKWVEAAKWAEAALESAVIIYPLWHSAVQTIISSLVEQEQQLKYVQESCDRILTEKGTC